ncbi:hypothetical protein [Chengkuizengella sediminis]|uniref:hypothetical protein n=1 Tax=Chengkuizengella sediminis TaxID=1885917 RepID=UPI001389F728|nr:hypothetical protein [Chengkuizengella sediminis]NDI36493.1 hypothetical protein [Chengkuizengella sediminis]
MIQKMKTYKILIFAGLFLFALVIGIYVYIINHPPLSSNGLTSNIDNTKVTLNIKNDGIRNVEIIDVFVNGDKVTKSVELGMSYSEKMVQLKDEPKYDIVFVNNFKENVIHPKTDDIDEAIKRNEPTDYGIRILHNKPIETIKIKYKYLGMSWELIKTLS